MIGWEVKSNTMSGLYMFNARTSWCPFSPPGRRRYLKIGWNTPSSYAKG
jgi:hypothetical protein